MAADGDRILKRALLLGGTLTLGVVAWGTVTETRDGGASVDVVPGAHPP